MVFYGSFRKTLAWVGCAALAVGLGIGVSGRARVEAQSAQDGGADARVTRGKKLLDRPSFCRRLDDDEGLFHGP